MSHKRKTPKDVDDDDKNLTEDERASMMKEEQKMMMPEELEAVEETDAAATDKQERFKFLAPPPVTSGDKGKEPAAAEIDWSSSDDDSDSDSSVDDDIVAESKDGSDDDEFVEDDVAKGVTFGVVQESIASPQSNFMKAMVDSGKAVVLEDGSIVGKDQHAFLKKVTGRALAAKDEDDVGAKQAEGEGEGDGEKNNKKRKHGQGKRKKKTTQKPNKDKAEAGVRQPLLENVDLLQGTCLALLKLVVNHFYDGAMAIFDGNVEDDLSIPTHNQIRNFQRMLKTHSAAEASRLLVVLFGEQVVGTVLESIQKTLSDDELRSVAAESAAEQIMIVLNHQGASIVSGTTKNHAAESIQMFKKAIATHVDDVYRGFTESKDKGNEVFAAVTKQRLEETFAYSFSVAKRVGKGKEMTIATHTFPHGASLSEVARFAYAQGGASRNLPSAFSALGALWPVAQRLATEFAEEKGWTHSKPPTGKSKKRARAAAAEAEEEEMEEGTEGAAGPQAVSVT